MKKVSVILSMAILLFVLVTACQQSKDKSETEADKTEEKADEQMAEIEYTCTMHPDVITKEPGKCPKCGMDLVKKESKEEGEHEHSDTTEHN